MFIETEVVELKKSLSQLKEGIISLSAMLNKSNKGLVYFGIRDDGKVVGLDVGKKTLADVTHEIQNNLKPLPNRVNVDSVVLEDREVIKVEVEGDDTPYSAYGRYYIRINDADVMMSNNQLQFFFENKEINYSRWENKETEYGVDDINEDLLIECVRTANDNGRLNYVYKNAEDALTKLGLLSVNGKLNNAGWYLFGNNKPLLIKEANFPTDSRSEFGEIKEFRGNIIECIRETISYIQNHITFKSNIIGYQREDVPEIPLRAIREIVVNSYAHCSYGIEGDYHQFSIFKSYVKIYNPGGIIKDIDPKRFASGNVGSKIRNVLIASTLFKFGYIDSFGTGFERTFSLCASNDVNYSYFNDEFGFTFIFNRKTINMINDNRLDYRISNLDDMIINSIKNNKYITIPELANIVNKSEITVHRHLNDLSKNGMISRVGSRKTGYWKINYEKM